MMKYKVGLVISVFDKLEDVTMCIELARLAGFFSILVVAEDEEITRQCLAKICNSDIEIRLVESVPYDVSKVKTKFDFFKKISIRVWQAQRTGLIQLSETCDYVMHTHADGWILSGEKVETIINTMNEKKCGIAFRGMGITFRNFPGSPTGSIDDHFYIVRSSQIQASLFLKKPLVDFLPGYFNIHGILSQWIISEIGISKAYYYDNTRSWLNWDNSKRNFEKGNPLRSFVYNSEYALLHCHCDDFPNKLGQALQARYIKKVKNYTDSKNLHSFVEKYQNENVLEDLLKLYKRKSLLLKLTLNFEEDYRNLQLMEQLLKAFRRKPIKTLIYNLAKNTYRLFKKKKTSSDSPNFPNIINDLYAQDDANYKYQVDEVAKERVVANQ